LHTDALAGRLAFVGIGLAVAPAHRCPYLGTVKGPPFAFTLGLAITGVLFAVSARHAFHGAVTVMSDSMGAGERCVSLEKERKED